MSFGMVAFLRTALVIVVGGYILIAAIMYVTQRSFLYFPDHEGLSASAAGLTGVTDVKLATKDGETLQAWYAPARPGKPTILFFHGNGGEISQRAERFAAFQGQGFGVFFLSYRGYGASTGSPSETGLMTDAFAAYDGLIAQGVKPETLVLVGESLGTGVAVQLAAERSVRALALEAPYSSAASVAGERYWWLPVRLLMKDKFDSLAFIKKVTAPLLIIHGDLDRAIPLHEGQTLFALANEPKQIVVVPDGTHGVIFSSDTWEREMRFFERYVSGAP